jgi:DNA-binding transcriptional regulator LsrR (DeoR family)
LTQQEIANRLGLTRLRVNRIVGQVRSDGLVRIEVDIPLALLRALEARLTTRIRSTT